MGNQGISGNDQRVNKKVYVHIENWRNRPLKTEYPYVYLDGIYLKRNWGGDFENVSVLVAIAVNNDGYREIIGAAEGMKEDSESWKEFLCSLKDRGLKGTRLFVGDKCLGLVDAINQVYPGAHYQGCIVHFYRNMFSTVPRAK